MDEVKLGSYLLPPMVLEAFGVTRAWPYDDYYRAEWLVKLGGTNGHDHLCWGFYEHEDDLIRAWHKFREFRDKHEALGHQIDFWVDEEGPSMSASWVIPATEEEIAAAKAYIEDPANKPPATTIQWRRPIPFTPTTKEQE